MAYGRSRPRGTIGNRRPYEVKDVQTEQQHRLEVLTLVLNNISPAYMGQFETSADGRFDPAIGQARPEARDFLRHLL